MPRSIEAPVRIRFEHTRYPHLGGHSGYVQFVRRLDAARFSSTVHAASDSDADLPRWLNPASPWLKRIVARAGMPWYKLSDLHAEIAGIAAGMTGRFDIVHFLDGEHSGRYLPRVLKRAGKTRVKTAATFHQPPDLAADLLHAESLRWLDQVVLVSPSQLAFFRQHVPEERLNVILHGVDTDFFRPSATAGSGNRMRCITVGHWLRDWKTFAAVARAMPDIEFDVVASRALAIEGMPNVRVHRAVDDFELAELYRKADILFLPLLQSTANNALLEGLASGLAVTATDLEAVRAYVPNGEAMLVEGGPDAFVQAIGRLGRDRVLLHEMKRRARQRAEELAWPNLVRRYESLYARMSGRENFR